ncbi:hypothetical protein RND71_023246 [Anisodus tanguticus]|uniref:Uncharacterized protein n=1 Tax=Anisodus tanguticus TaxID=243964 RepID=A0AAE1RV79_9SOLA|nr:hypothetical protein RND71_023246 [Anisodus tanguticus]
MAEIRYEATPKVVILDDDEEEDAYIRRGEDVFRGILNEVADGFGEILASNLEIPKGLTVVVDILARVDLLRDLSAAAQLLRNFLKPKGRMKRETCDLENSLSEQDSSIHQMRDEREVALFVLIEANRKYDLTLVGELRDREEVEITRLKDRYRRLRTHNKANREAAELDKN